MRCSARSYDCQLFNALARKAIHRLQQIDASGIYGDDYGYKTIWDEFCHEIQYGPHDDIVDSAWSTTIQPFLKAAIGSLTVKEKAVLFFATEEADDFDENAESTAPIDDDAIGKEVLSALKEIAGKRNLERFEGNRCYSMYMGAIEREAVAHTRACRRALTPADMSSHHDTANCDKDANDDATLAPALNHLPATSMFTGDAR